MIISKELTDKGFSFENVDETDLCKFLEVKKACYKQYVNQYYGGWVDDVQIGMNTNVFDKTRNQDCFQKILFKGEVVGFFGYNESADRIEGITIQMMDKARNHGVGSHYLEQIILLSNRWNKPAFLKVFKSNPAQNLYKRYGFVVYDETPSHYLMRYDPIIK